MQCIMLLTSILRLDIRTVLKGVLASPLATKRGMETERRAAKERPLTLEAYMAIGDRLREMRVAKKLSQGDIEKRTGLLRCYISRVENGHTVPAIETLEELARALEVPLYQLFYDGEEPPVLPNLPKRKTADDIAWGSKGKDA